MIYGSDLKEILVNTERNISENLKDEVNNLVLRNLEWFVSIYL